MKLFNTLCAILLFLLGLQGINAQVKVKSGSIEVNPYAGYSMPTGTLRDYANNGFAAGLSVDKYFNSKFALGFDFNLQSNGTKSPFGDVKLNDPYRLRTNNNGNWKSYSMTFGPTYKVGNEKFNTELFSKFGVLYTKTPSINYQLQGNQTSKEVFRLPEQERTGFGLNVGTRFNFKIKDHFYFFLSPQYIYGSKGIEYCDCGYDEGKNPEEIFNSTPIKKSFSSSYFNINAGLVFDIVKDDPNPDNNLNIPTCRINGASLECTSTGNTLNVNIQWSGMNTQYEAEVKLFDSSGNLLNTPYRQSLGINYGVTQYPITGVSTALIGTTARVELNIYNTNGSVICTSDLNFQVPQCNPQPPTCTMIADTANGQCTPNGITYSFTSNWSNFAVGKVIDLVIKDQNNTSISPIAVSPNPFPITITSANTTGNASGTITLPASYANQSVFTYLSVTDPTTGQSVHCGNSDYSTLICNTNPSCEATFKTLCNPKNNDILISTPISWSNMPAGTQVSFEIIDLVNGGLIPFTVMPNPNTYPISGTGSATFNLFVSAAYQNQPYTIHATFTDANGVRICRKGRDDDFPKCNYTSCGNKLTNISCDDGTPTVDFDVNWTNISNFTNYRIYTDIVDSNNTNLGSATNTLTGINGTRSITMTIPPGHGGENATIKIRICEVGGIKNCCTSEIPIEVPYCCEKCGDISMTDTTNSNQNGQSQWTNYFRSVATITSSPVDKIVITLESFGANNSTNNAPLPNPNFEISGAGVTNTSVNYNARPISSIPTNRPQRSNIWVIDFPNTPFTGGDLHTIISPYDQKILKNYRIKVMFYKIDGTYCEKYLNYNN